jgi:hypothetical protein
MKLSDKYRMVMEVNIKDGDTAMFWADKWNGLYPQDAFPRLFSFSIYHTLYVKEVLLLPDISSLFHTPLSQQAQQELNSLQSWIVGITLVPYESDSWSTIWKGGLYTVKSFYIYSFRHITCSKVHSWI